MSLELRAISHRYETDPFVLQDVQLTLEPGSITAIMGPSGSGKSTLLAIAGLLFRPTFGEVRHDGSPAGSGSLSQVSWIFQSSNLFPRRSAVENAMMGPLGRGFDVESARRLAGAALVDVGVGHLAEVPVRFVSGGEGQRVGVARALASRPSFLFADEPTGQLDSASTEVVLDAISRRRGAGRVTLIATHDPVVAAACDRTYVMAKGKLQGGG